MNQRRYDGREAVIVAETNIIGFHGVVLIDDGDRTESEQLTEGISGVRPAFVAYDGLLCQQKLGGGLAVFGEEFLIDHHQLPLTDRGARLLLPEGVKLSESHGGSSDRDGPR